MRTVPKYPDQVGVLAQDFYFSETPLEHWAEEFYQTYPYGNYLVFEGWWDNPVDCWIQTGHLNVPIEVVAHNLPADFSLVNDGKRVTLHRDIKKHLSRYPIEELRYHIDTDVTQD